MQSAPSARESFGPVNGASRVDVAVVGGGITGMLVAHRLRQSGMSVAIIEAHAIGASNTGLSTGNLYAPLSSGMRAMLKRWGCDVAQHVAHTRQLAVDSIEQLVQRHAIDCGFVRCPLTYAMEAPDAEQQDAWESERAAYEEAGLHPREGSPTLPFACTHRFHVIGQAQFNPYLFTRAMAAQLASESTAIHEHSPVLDLDASRGEVVTANGTVTADHIVLATHTPLGFNLVQAEMEVHREYGIALALEGSMQDGIHWIRDQGRSVRRHVDGDREWLVVVGEKHKTGEIAPDVDYWARLEDCARARFAVGEVSSRWSAQQFSSADGLPYIGPSAHGNVWLATGFGADGLTWGAVAAQLIGEGIEGVPSESAKLLSPRRFTPVKSAKGWAKENATVMRHLVGDRMSKPVQGVEDVRPGEGRLVDADGDRYAVYRDDDGKLCMLSPVCPHLKCIVQWNGMEKTWDCPCHGSRFTPQGEVIEGPSLSGLARVEAGGRVG